MWNIPFPASSYVRRVGVLIHVRLCCYTQPVCMCGNGWDLEKPPRQQVCPKLFDTNFRQIENTLIAKDCQFSVNFRFHLSKLNRRDTGYIAKPKHPTTSFTPIFASFIYILSCAFIRIVLYNCLFSDSLGYRNTVEITAPDRLRTFKHASAVSCLSATVWNVGNGT